MLNANINNKTHHIAVRCWSIFSASLTWLTIPQCFSAERTSPMSFFFKQQINYIQYTLCITKTNTHCVPYIFAVARILIRSRHSALSAIRSWSTESKTRSNAHFRWYACVFLLVHFFIFLFSFFCCRFPIVLQQLNDSIWTETTMHPENRNIFGLSSLVRWAL